jgi:hypothetical protein
MSPEKKAHLKQNVRRMQKLQISKYVKGQVEHGGQMWKKTGMLHAALEEVADLANYLPTIELQIAKALRLIKAGKDPLPILEGLLSRKIEMPVDNSPMKD